MKMKSEHLFYTKNNTPLSKTEEGHVLKTGTLYYNLVYDSRIFVLYGPVPRLCRFLYSNKILPVVVPLLCLPGFGSELVSVLGHYNSLMLSCSAYDADFTRKIFEAYQVEFNLLTPTVSYSSQIKKCLSRHRWL